MKPDSNENSLELCRDFRKKPTQAEARMWVILRDKRLGGYKFRRQHPMMGYILDFYCPELKLAIEVDGQIHGDEQQQKYDQERTTSLRESGILVIRFWNSEVLHESSSVINRIQEFINLRKQNH